jgi:hypothetical protein
MEKYLVEIVHEYERNLGRWNGTTQLLLGDRDLQKLRDFLTLVYEKPNENSRLEDSRLKVEFVDVYSTVIKTIQQEILEMR